MELLVIGASALLGLLFGSFANVVIHRVPAGESIVSPASACPACATPIAPYDNVPVVSWLVLRGRCRRCGESISIRYPLVELAMAVVFGLVGATIGATWALPAYLLFAWTLVVVAVIDAETRKIPNRLTYPLTPTLLVLLVGAALASGTPGAAVRAVLAGGAGFLALLVIALIQPRGMGMGDVKLAGFIGLGLGYLGWGLVVLGLFGAFVLGGVIGMLLIGLRVRSRKDMIPFGPYLSLSALLALLVGGPVIDAYLRTLGL